MLPYPSIACFALLQVSQVRPKSVQVVSNPNVLSRSKTLSGSKSISTRIGQNNYHGRLNHNKNGLVCYLERRVWHFIRPRIIRIKMLLGSRPIMLHPIE